MQIFLDEKIALFMGTLAEDMDDVRMRQTSQKPGFALQATCRRRPGGEIRQEYLTRQGADIGGAPDLVQLGYAAGAQMTDDGEVAPNAGPKLKREAGSHTGSPPWQLWGRA